MNINEKFNKFMQKPGYYTRLIALELVSIFLPDKIFLKRYYRIKQGCKLNLKNPKTFTEKMQWLKLYDRKPIYTIMADKYKAKEYIGNIIGKEHIVPLLGVWDNAKEIDFDNLPNQFVLKCNHDSRSWIFCKNKKEFDIDAARKFLNKKLKNNHYMKCREWSYKNIERKIIAEKYLEDRKDKSGYFGLADYKFFCTNGKARMMYISHDIDNDSKFDAFDMDYNRLDMFSMFNETIPPKKTKFFDDMRKDAEKLSKGIPFVRVDFYVVNNQYYFGEMTFYPMGGIISNQSHDFSDTIYNWNKIIGDWIKLPKRPKQKRNFKKNFKS